MKEYDVTVHIETTYRIEAPDEWQARKQAEEFATADFRHQSGTSIDAGEAVKVKTKRG